MALSPRLYRANEVERAWSVPYALAFERPLQTARGCFPQRRGWWLAIQDSVGNVGWGEAAPWPGFGSSFEAVEHALDCILMSMSMSSSSQDPGISTEAWAALPPEVIYAVELAHLDLQAQRAGLPLARLLRSSARASVPAHALVTDPERATIAVRRGFGRLKIKVGAAPIADDDARIGAIRAAVGPEIALHLDANGAWDLSAAAQAIGTLARHELAWIEQPVGSIAELATLRSAVDVHIAADEVCTDLDALDRIIESRGADLVVIKPMFAGGLWAATAMAERAEQAGVGVIVTGALESAVGRAGALHWAAALKTPALSCGLESPIEADVAPWPAPVGGDLPVPTGPGLGVIPRWEPAP